MATKEPLAWGLCYNKEMDSNYSYYCDEHYNNTYPCTPGVSYYGRGALPIYWYLPFSFLLISFLNLESYVLNFFNLTDNDQTSFALLHLNY